MPPSIYVANYNGNHPTVTGFTAACTAPIGYAAPTNFVSVQGIAVDASSNTVYAADSNTGKIRTLNATTGAETTNAGFANAPALSTPYGLTLAGGNLLAASLTGNTVAAFNAATGAAATGFTSPAGLSNPIGLVSLQHPLRRQRRRRHRGQRLRRRVQRPHGRARARLLAHRTELPRRHRGVRQQPLRGQLYQRHGGRVQRDDGHGDQCQFHHRVANGYGLAVANGNLLVDTDSGTAVAAYGIPTTAVVGNVPTSTNPDYLTGLNDPGFLAVASGPLAVPEPSIWAGLALGALGLGVVILRRRTAPAVLPG